MRSKTKKYTDRASRLDLRSPGVADVDPECS